MPTTAAPSIGERLRDPELFRQACFVNGQWIAAAGGASIPVDNPATGEIIGSVPKLGRAETAERHRRRGRGVPGVARA